MFKMEKGRMTIAKFSHLVTKLVFIHNLPECVLYVILRTRIVARDVQVFRLRTSSLNEVIVYLTSA